MFNFLNFNKNSGQKVVYFNENISIRKFDCLHCDIKNIDRDINAAVNNRNTT